MSRQAPTSIVLTGAGRGIGAALVRRVCAWTAQHGFDHVTLTTFRAVAWNMPFYARMGFGVLDSADYSPELRAIVTAESARGLRPEERVVMAYSVRKGES